ncbi:cupin domain-containing protein [Phytohabitans flavus]|uniref:Cupin n=1 Tax=Phytohabitans flavus TaxID=1076124 RepID=A0A6F8XVP5_9ACTN|nr:cupin [Phytohabitans flavus]
MTGATPDGKSVWASDETIEPVRPIMLPGAIIHKLWGGDGVPELPHDGTPPEGLNYLPGPGGYRLYVYTVPPAMTYDGRKKVDREEGLADLQRKLPGLTINPNSKNPGMHATDTVDFQIIVEGEVVLELDDGAEKVLKAGDVVVLNGDRHKWHNRSGVDATMVGIMIGARRDQPDSAAPSPAPSSLDRPGPANG